MVGLLLLVSLAASAPRLELRVGTPPPGKCGWRPLLEQQLRLTERAVLTAKDAEAVVEVTRDGDGVRVRVTARSGEVLAERQLQRASCSTWARLVALVIDRAVHDVRWSGSTSLGTGTVAAPTPDIPLPPPPRPPDGGAPSREPLPPPVGPAPDAGPPTPPTFSFSLSPGDGGDLRRPSFEAPDAGSPPAVATVDAGAGPLPAALAPADAGAAPEVVSLAPDAGAEAAPEAPPPVPDAGAPVPWRWAFSASAGYSVQASSGPFQTGPALTLFGAWGPLFAAVDGTLLVVPTPSAPIVIQNRERGQLTAGGGTVRAGAGLCARWSRLSLCGGPSATLVLQRVTATGVVFQAQPVLQVAPLLGGQVRPMLVLGHFVLSLLVDAQAALFQRRATVEGTTAALSTPAWAISSTLFVGLWLP